MTTSTQCARRHALIELLEARRLMAVGDLDDSFGSDGTTALPREGGKTGFGLVVTHLSTLSDGRIVAAGWDGERPYFQRLQADGQIDTSFPQTALIDALAARIGTPLDAAAAASDRILVRGDGILPGKAPVLTAVAAGRRMPRIDPAFGKRGIIHLPFAAPRSFSGSGSLAVLPDGRIVATGVSRIMNDEFEDRSAAWGMTLVRPNGRVDAAFGGGDGVIDVGQISHTFDSQEGITWSSEFINGERFFALPDGRFIYVRERSVSNRAGFEDELITVTTVEALVVSTDGTTAPIDGFDRTGQLGEESRQLPDGSVQIVFASTAPSTATIAADGSLIGVTPGLPSGAIPAQTVFATDGQRLATLEPSEGRVLVAKYQTTDAPTALQHAPPLRHGRAAYRFTVTWHDDDGIDVSTLADGPTIIVDFPNGATRSAHFLSANPSSDATTVTARYHVVEPVDGWNANDNGVYRVRLRRGEVADTSGRTASGRALGHFVVDIPAPPVLPDPDPDQPPDIAPALRLTTMVAMGDEEDEDEAHVFDRLIRGGDF